MERSLAKLNAWLEAHEAAASTAGDAPCAD
jgi:hypothetical protein